MIKVRISKNSVRVKVDGEQIIKFSRSEREKQFAGRYSFWLTDERLTIAAFGEHSHIENVVSDQWRKPMDSDMDGIAFCFVIVGLVTLMFAFVALLQLGLLCYVPLSTITSPDGLMVARVSGTKLFGCFTALHKKGEVVLTGRMKHDNYFFGCKTLVGYGLTNEGVLYDRHTKKVVISYDSFDPSTVFNPKFDLAKFSEYCAKGNAEAVKAMLLHVDPGVRDNYAIKWAAKNGHSEVVKLLLADKRVDPKAALKVANLSPEMRTLLHTYQLPKCPLPGVLEIAFYPVELEGLTWSHVPAGPIGGHGPCGGPRGPLGIKDTLEPGKSTTLLRNGGCYARAHSGDLVVFTADKIVGRIKSTRITSLLSRVGDDTIISHNKIHAISKPVSLSRDCYVFIDKKLV